VCHLRSVFAAVKLRSISSAVVQARQLLRADLTRLGAERQELVGRLRQFATGQEPSWEVGLGCARRVRRNMEEEVSKAQNYTFLQYRLDGYTHVCSFITK